MINDELLDDPDEVAEAYQQKLVTVFARINSVGVPRFDLVLLELGSNDDALSFSRGRGLLRGKDKWATLREDDLDP